MAFSSSVTSNPMWSALTRSMKGSVIAVNKRHEQC
jgi:hypothetical protein